jgi:hypothetical protein
MCFFSSSWCLEIKWFLKFQSEKCVSNAWMSVRLRITAPLVLPLSHNEHVASEKFITCSFLSDFSFISRLKKNINKLWKDDKQKEQEKQKIKAKKKNNTQHFLFSYPIWWNLIHLQCVIVFMKWKWFYQYYEEKHENLGKWRLTKTKTKKSSENCCDVNVKDIVQHRVC